MKRITLKTYTPAEKLPKSSTPMTSHVVLILARQDDREQYEWRRGIYIEALKQWRMELQNWSMQVKWWCELPGRV